MSMGNILNNIQSNPTETHRFLSWWFGDDTVDMDSLVSIMRIHPTEPRNRSYVFSIKEVLDAVETSGLDSLIYDQSGSYYDLYFSVGTLKTRPEKNKRGSLKHVGTVSGVWIDLDVKEGAFPDNQSVRDFLNSLEVVPSAVVYTGSGGAHAYWKFKKPQTAEVVKNVALSWWAYQTSLSAYPIDKLCDPTRILRLPGSIRWPKNTEQTPATVDVIYTGLTYSVDDLLSVSSEAFESYTARIQNNKKRIETGIFNGMKALESFNPSHGDNFWSNLITISHIEDWFNDTYDWYGILNAKGWTYLGVDDMDRNMWSRPDGGMRKSATTDWPESPHVMSLFSTAPETGLSDLLESGIPLTKYRVYVELFCGSDDGLAISTLKESILRDKDYWDRLR